MIDYDPTHIEARYRGALREISPAMRADWAAADRQLRIRQAIVRSLIALALVAGIVAWVLL